MKLKKGLIALTTILATAMIILNQNIAYATTATTPLDVKLSSTNASGNGYSIGLPTTTGSYQKLWSLWSIVNNYHDTTRTLYCVNSGVGFGTLTDTRTYNSYLNMETEQSTIAALSSPYYNSVGSSSYYNEILWILDNIFIPNDAYYTNNTAQKELDRLALLKAAGIEFDSTTSTYTYYPVGSTTYKETSVVLTNEEIEAVQQSALWYYTNHDNTVLTKTPENFNLYYTTDGINYTLFSNYSAEKDQQAKLLYKYFIETAATYHAGYTPTAPLKINVGGGTLTSGNNYTMNVTNNGTSYTMGPININKLTDTAYDLSIDVLNQSGDPITEYTFTDANGNDLGKDINALISKDFYITVTDTKVLSIYAKITTSYKKVNKTFWYSTTSNIEQPLAEPTISKESEEINLIGTIIKQKTFDLSLRKYIVKVDGVAIGSSRVPTIDYTTLATGTTATYKHEKAPVAVTTNSIVTYNITTYNEGEKDGYATKIVDQLPTGIVSNLKTGDTVTSSKGNTYEVTYDTTTNKLIFVLTSTTPTKLNAYVPNSNTLDLDTIELNCTVTAKADSVDMTVFTNIAWINEEYNVEDSKTITNQVGEDRDSEPSTAPNKTADELVTTDIGYTGNASNKTDLTDSGYFYQGLQDDNDFEKLVMVPKAFDLKLVKFVTQVNGSDVPNRLTKVNVSKLNTIDSNGNLITTADYTLTKDPVGVKKNDYITYTFRVYNEGDIAGYAQEITENIPDGLEFVWANGIVVNTDGTINFDNTTGLTDTDKEAIEYNSNMLWGYTTDSIDANGKITKVSTNYLSKDVNTDNLINAFDSSKGYLDTATDKNPDYKEVSIMLKVVSDKTTATIIRNEAEISDDADSNGDTVKDRDSSPEDWKKEDSNEYYDENKNWPIYKEDDEDYDNVQLQYFDLALRKFITEIGDTSITSRVPQVIYENGKIEYQHSKEPLNVVKDDIVTYTLRVYNEGNIDGYAKEISDDIPQYLEYLPENDTNKTYKWVMYDENGNTTTDVTKAVKIKTLYLSKENGEEMMKKDSSLTENPNLIKAFDETTIYYKNVQVSFKVKDPGTSDYVITNYAQISDDEDSDGKPVEDIDSTPDKWNEGEDDQDIENIKLQYFDLALKKFVTNVITIEDGKETVTATGHTGDENPEPIVKVELHRKKLSAITVKFGYTIKVTNEGDIAGYVKEITDYVPQGLKFVAADNQNWTDEGNNVISTKQLEDTLLQPGESATVQVTLTWINGADNIGVKTNTAEISEDYNDKNVPDKDSTPDNKVPGEDDIDTAEVMLSIATGQERIYYVLGAAVLIILASGLVIIKKFVL